MTWINTGAKHEHLLSSFHNSYNLRIAVTVDMIATGTDIKPMEIVFFMRTVRSRNFFEQVTIRNTDLVGNDHFLQANLVSVFAKFTRSFVDLRLAKTEAKRWLKHAISIPG